MSWFRRTDPWEELLRARLTWICTALLIRVKTESEKNGYDYETVLRTRWFNAYLLGFPQPLDEVNAIAGGVARKALFLLTHGDQADSFVRKSAAYLELDDEQSRRGVGAGVPDGQRCWKAIADSKDLTDDTFQSLEAFFAMKSIDQNLTIEAE